MGCVYPQALEPASSQAAVLARAVLVAGLAMGAKDAAHGDAPLLQHFDVEALLSVRGLSG